MSSTPQSLPPMHLRGRGPAFAGSVRIEKARDVRGTLVRLLAYLRPYTWMLAVILALTILGTVLGVSGPYLIGVAIDRFIARGNVPGLLRIALLMVGLYLANWLAQTGQDYLMATVTQKALRALRRDLFEHLQRLSLSFFDQRPHGELMSRLTNDIDAINQALSQNVTQMVVSLLTMVGIVGMMFALNLWLALGTMAVLPLMLLLTAVVAQRTRQGFRRLQMQLGQLNGLMEETLSGERVVQAFGQEAAAVAAFDKANLAVREVGIRAQVFPMLIPPLMGTLSNMNTAVVAGLGGWLALHGLVSVGVIATFVAYSRRLADPLRQMSHLYNVIQAALAGAERIFEILDQQPEIVDAPDAVVLDDVAGEVVFDHVDFSYLPDVPVLKDMSLEAKPGQIIALVGPTGAGKTTMVNVLSRFYDLQGGAIRIDGRDIRHIKQDSLRRQLGIVLQDTFLFSDTVMENIRYGRLDASDEEVFAAARLANADQFIRRLPQGYQTMLSERGSNLSQGQRQLLAIARAILADPRVLILDEATSSVDTRTEVRIQEALLRLMEGRTSFVIAHRLSTIRNADQILVINDGRIIERGTHDELLAQRGFYYHLYMSQFKGRAIGAERKK
jgi:ATP-binding cassette subfamily B multidrug efflux pump